MGKYKLIKQKDFQMKKISFLLTILLAFTLNFAGPTLEERANAELGRPDTTTATLVERIDQAIKQGAQMVINEEILPSDTSISNHATVTKAQLTEWGLRGLRTKSSGI